MSKERISHEDAVKLAMSIPAENREIMRKVLALLLTIPEEDRQSIWRLVDALSEER